MGVSDELKQAYLERKHIQGEWRALVDRREALARRIEQLEGLELQELMAELKRRRITDKAIAIATGCSIGTVGRWRLAWRINSSDLAKLRAMVAEALEQG